MFEVGEIVVSTAGRDRDRTYLVLACYQTRALVCDGARRVLAKPKRKNLRHLQSCGKVAAELAERLRRGERVLDAEIRMELANWRAEAELASSEAE